MLLFDSISALYKVCKNNYFITPYNSCYKLYIERPPPKISFKKCIFVHIKYFNLDDHWNARVKHNLETRYSFNFKDTKMLFSIHKKHLRKSVEFRIISNDNIIKGPVFFNLSLSLVELVLKTYNISYFN